VGGTEAFGYGNRPKNDRIITIQCFQKQNAKKRSLKSKKMRGSNPKDGGTHQNSYIHRPPGKKRGEGSRKKKQGVVRDEARGHIATTKENFGGVEI